MTEQSSHYQSLTQIIRKRPSFRGSAERWALSSGVRPPGSPEAVPLRVAVPRVGLTDVLEDIVAACGYGRSGLRSPQGPADRLREGAVAAALEVQEAPVFPGIAALEPDDAPERPPPGPGPARRSCRAQGSARRRRRPQGVSGNGSALCKPLSPTPRAGPGPPAGLSCRGPR
jgi:hypothetical protein